MATDTPKIALIVLNYKRFANIARIVNYYSTKLPIFIVNNNPAIVMKKPPEVEKVVNNRKNKWCIERWYQAMSINSEYICLLDDDLLVDYDSILHLLKVAEENPYSLVGIYGKMNLQTATCYEELEDVWCVKRDVDIVVGSCIVTRTANIRAIHDSYIQPFGYNDRGDDILVSMALTNLYGVKHKVEPAKVEQLPEGNVALSQDPNHYLKRWQVVKYFRELHSSNKL